MWLWLIVAFLFFAIGVFALGYADLNEDEKIGIFWVGFIASLCWPVVLTAVIMFGPFFGLFWLGTRLRSRKENSSSNK